MGDLAATLEASAVAQALRTSFVAYPLVNATHILGAGGLVAMVWMMHAARTDDRFGSEILHRRIVVAVIVAMSVTGLALFSVQALEYLGNPAFRIKAALIAIAIGNVALHHGVARRSAGLARMTIVLSAIIWPAILVAGRFIGFV